MIPDLENLLCCYCKRIIDPESDRQSIEKRKSGHTDCAWRRNDEVFAALGAAFDESERAATADDLLPEESIDADGRIWVNPKKVKQPQRSGKTEGERRQFTPEILSTLQTARPIPDGTKSDQNKVKWSDEVAGMHIGSTVMKVLREIKRAQRERDKGGKDD